MGRKLAGIFVSAGLSQVETGVLGGEWRHPGSPGETELEWEVLAADLVEQIPPFNLQKMKQVDLAARKTGERVLFVPTFYASGRA
jgi:hypothetical protein